MESLQFLKDMNLIMKEVENGKSDTVWVATFTDVAGEILKQINEIRKKRIENKNT